MIVLKVPSAKKTFYEMLIFLIVTARMPCSAILEGHWGQYNTEQNIQYLQIQRYLSSKNWVIYGGNKKKKQLYPSSEKDKMKKYHKNIRDERMQLNWQQLVACAVYKYWDGCAISAYKSGLGKWEMKNVWNRKLLVTDLYLCLI